MRGTILSRNSYNTGHLGGHCKYTYPMILLNSDHFFFFLRFYLFILRDTHTERGRDTGRGRSRLRAGSLMGDSIPGSQDHTLSQRQTLNCWTTQVPPCLAFMGETNKWWLWGRPLLILSFSCYSSQIWSSYAHHLCDLGHGPLSALFSFGKLAW